MLICCDCGRPCEAKQCDGGIGAYEYGSIRDVHHDYYTGSDCCSAEVVEGGEKIVRQVVHVARKSYGRIKMGQKYKLTVYRTWRKNGPSWMRSERQPV